MQKDDSTDDEQSLCVAILKSGTRKGKECGSKAAYDKDTHCKKHAKDKTPKEKVVCGALVARGKNAGKPCAKEGTYPGGVCGHHYSKEKEEEETSVGSSSTRCLEVIALGAGVYVLGVNGSMVDRAKWKAFYEKHTKQDYPERCCAKDCENIATCTGHMYLRDDPVKRYNYLIPICPHHNGKKYDTEAFLLKKTTVAVKIRENPSVKK